MTVAELKKSLEGLDDNKEIMAYSSGCWQKLDVGFSEQTRYASDGYAVGKYYKMIGTY